MKILIPLLCGGHVDSFVRHSELRPTTQPAPTSDSRETRVCPSAMRVQAIMVISGANVWTMKNATDLPSSAWAPAIFYRYARPREL